MYYRNTVQYHDFKYIKPLADGIKLWTLCGLPVFLPSDQLSGSPCRTQGAGNQRFCNYVYMSALFSIMQYLCIVHVYMYMHTYALCGYTAGQPAQWHLSKLLLLQAAAAAIAVNRTQGDLLIEPLARKKAAESNKLVHSDTNAMCTHC